MATLKFTRDQVIEAVQGTGGIKTVIAQKLGVHRNTVENYAKKWKGVEAAIKQEQEGVIDLAEAAFVTKIREGHWPSIKFALETKGRHRDYVTRTEQEQIGTQDVRVRWDGNDDPSARTS